MRVNDRQESGWSTDVDDRRTKFGSLLRKTSIDELPQLFNILRGDMSLVGPRPEVPFYVEQFRETIPLYMVKNQVRPGITGWAQINGYRGDTSIEERIKHDLWYIENWSLGLDIVILFRTAFGGMINQEKN
jgi:lipopolysaccharide/colanic/teichoic acid biosynthesis glycosyltransferase